MRRVELEQGRRVVEWYDRNKRDLPWRHTKDPYRILVSEIMLQQTRAEAVEKRWPQFVERFPTIQALARADEDEVLKAWEGLGYYSRARNLQRAAQHICEHSGGIVPSSQSELLEIPGIGAYTAGAVLAIAYDLPAVAVDANAIRVITRVLELGSSLRFAKTRCRIEEEMLCWLPADRPGAFAQGMMDLGSMICRAQAPLCDECPVQDFCAACKDGIQEQFPLRTHKKKTPVEQWTAVCFCSRDRMAFVRRPRGGILAGMYGPPMIRQRPTATGIHMFAAQLGLEVSGIDMGPEWTHVFSHVRWEIASWIAEVHEPHGTCGFVWVDRGELRERIAVPTAFRPLTEFWKNA